MFNSNILTESASNSLDRITPDESNFFTDLLEFNDIMHQIELDYEYKRYRALKEDADIDNGKKMSEKEITALKESMLSDFKEKILKAIQAIIDFVRKLYLL